MRWPWKQRADDVGSGQAARIQAERALDAERARTPEVIRLARELRELRQRNHFAEAIGKAMGVRR